MPRYEPYSSISRYTARLLENRDSRCFKPTNTGGRSEPKGNVMHHSPDPSIPSLSEDIKKSLIAELKQFVSTENEAINLGITAQQRQAILQQQTRDFTIDKLVDMVLRAGRRIHCTFEPPSR
jgi:predicted XRE-type DNA-binding protein